MIPRSTLLLMFCSFALRADLDAARAEPNLEKRSERALDNAEALMKPVRESYQAGDWKKVTETLEEVRLSVELCWESLQASGKNPRKSPKYFKRAELRTRDLARRLESFAQQVGIDDRPTVQKVALRVEEIHEELLLSVMSKK